MSDEPRFHLRRVYFSGSASPPGEHMHPAGGVYFSAPAGGHVCLVPEVEPTPLAIVGEQAPAIDGSVLEKLQRHNLEHLQHRMILTAARPVPADAAFVHREGRQTLAAYEIRTRDRRRFRAWSVFFFVDLRRPRRRVVHCIVRPCTPGGGLEVDCRAARPFRAANESWAEHTRDIKQAWGMLISYRAVACEAAQPTIGYEDPSPPADAGGTSGDERLVIVHRDESDFLKCARLGALTSVGPSLHLDLTGALDFVSVLRVFDVDLCVEMPLRGFHRVRRSETKASRLLDFLSHERLILQVLTEASVWRHYHAESCGLYLADLVRVAEAFRTLDLHAAVLRSNMIGTTERSWPAMASCFGDHLHQLWGSPARAACFEDNETETSVQ